MLDRPARGGHPDAPARLRGTGATELVERRPTCEMVKMLRSRHRVYLNL